MLPRAVRLPDGNLESIPENGPALINRGTSAHKKHMGSSLLQEHLHHNNVIIEQSPYNK